MPRGCSTQIRARASDNPKLVGPRLSRTPSPSFSHLERFETDSTFSLSTFYGLGRGRKNRIAPISKNAEPDKIKVAGSGLGTIKAELNAYIGWA